MLAPPLTASTPHHTQTNNSIHAARGAVTDKAAFTAWYRTGVGRLALLLHRKRVGDDAARAEMVDVRAQL